MGSRWALELGAEIAGVTLPEIPTIVAVDQLEVPVGLIDVGIERPHDFQVGAVQAQAGRLAVHAVEWAARACLADEVAAMVTCPLNKEAIHLAGYVDDLGHQEILARLAGVDWTATMLMTPGLRVAHLSTHKSLIEAFHFPKHRS